VVACETREVLAVAGRQWATLAAASPRRAIDHYVRIAAQQGDVENGVWASFSG
jgi:hypothetical protein